jgi:hypothetical protein
VFIDYLRLFNEKPECVFDKAAYCANYKFWNAVSHFEKFQKCNIFHVHE